MLVLFLVSHFNLLFIPCGGLSWLPVSFLQHVKYTLSYRIVSTFFLSTLGVHLVFRFDDESVLWNKNSITSVKLAG